MELLSIFEKKEWKQITDLLWEYRPKHQDEPKIRVNTVTEQITIEDKTKKTFLPLNCKHTSHALVFAEEAPNLGFSTELALLRSTLHPVMNAAYVEEEDHNVLAPEVLEEIEAELLEWWNKNLDKPNRFYKS